MFILKIVVSTKLKLDSSSKQTPMTNVPGNRGDWRLFKPPLKRRNMYKATNYHRYMIGMYFADILRRYGRER